VIPRSAWWEVPIGQEWYGTFKKKTRWITTLGYRYETKSHLPEDSRAGDDIELILTASGDRIAVRHRTGEPRRVESHQAAEKVIFQPMEVSSILNGLRMEGKF
jgi:hypothetical protein